MRRCEITAFVFGKDLGPDNIWHTPSTEHSETQLLTYHI